MENVIDLKGIRRRFGPSPALDGLDLVVERGQVVGLLGPNGAGKTTMRILRGLIRADAGVVRRWGWTLTMPPGAPPDRLPRGGLFPERDLASAAALLSLPDVGRRVPGRASPSARTLLAHAMDFRAASSVPARPDAGALGAALLDGARSRRRHASRVRRASCPARRRGDHDPLLEPRLSDVERLAERVAILDRGRLVLHEALDTLKERVRQVIGAGEPPPCARLLRARTSGRETAWTVLDPDLAGLERQRAAGLPREIRTLAFEDLFLDLIAAEKERARHGVA
jgi:ABC-2 type transport system ATP-binding protein